ncbi:MAG: hypothetical protein P0Y58_18495 [Candidatus Pseudomonas phytovorans]|uniref:Uncharacterized protein n=1 Tax=Candidatus Pseudomonas phytovorans TaxID=3121377 RepID=A0AAJ5WHK7_9PSED|nr:hypothetical protein [Pseudomonas sp.]WEK28890.1 MAG: hypothetical protein P0Y58_18495 [Pseudomonas sp.]
MTASHVADVRTFRDARLIVRQILPVNRVFAIPVAGLHTPP